MVFVVTERGVCGRDWTQGFVFSGTLYGNYGSTNLGPKMDENSVCPTGLILLWRRHPSLVRPRYDTLYEIMDFVSEEPECNWPYTLKTTKTTETGRLRSEKGS